MSMKDFVANITGEQKKNWAKLIKFMREKNAGYRHEEFSNDEYDGFCILSYAIAAGIVTKDDDDKSSKNSYSFSNYVEVFGDLFGEDAHGKVANFDDDFEEYCSERHVILQSSLNSKFMADILETLILGIDARNIKHVIVTWKNGKKDKFSDMDMLRTFFELNPERADTCKKVVAVKLVERIVIDEVEETVDDWR